MASPRLSPASPATTCCSILAPSSPSSSSPWQGPCAPPSMPDGRRAVFLDRDGTIVDDPSPGFLHEPGRVRLLPGAAEAIHRLNEAGWLVVTVSNQSGIARGLYDEAAFAAVQRRLRGLLAAHGAHLRSGERRVGEEGRSRWSADHLKKKKQTEERGGDRGEL